MRYVTGAAVAALLLVGVHSLQSAGAQTSDSNVVCTGEVTIPAGQVNTPFTISCPTDPIDFVATVNPGESDADVWVASVRGNSSYIRIHLNKASPVSNKVAWIGFTYHR